MPFLELLLGVSAISDEHRVALSAFRDECLGGMSTGQLSQSLEPTDAFLTREKEQEWASHDAGIDAMWDEFVADIVKLGEGTINREDLVKPSGPLRAVLTFFWHYPTWRTQKKAFGHVFDKSNPSLRFQHSKVGPNGWVRTHNRFPFRHPYVKGRVDWEAEYQNWADIEARCHRFNKEMMKHSKVIFFIGQENHDSWQRFITLGQGDRIHQVQLGGSPGINLPDSVYKARPAFHTVRDSTGTVKQLVFSSYHSQYCINGRDTVRGAYMDLVWNAAMNFADLEINQYDTFTRGMGLDPKDDTRFRCCFVDPETEERCCATRKNLRYVKKHWDSCHSQVEGASWSEDLVTELPKDVALALDPGSHLWSGKVYTNAERQAAHKEAALRRKEERERANAVPVVKERQRVGRRPKEHGKTKYRCHFIDPKTGEQCKITYGTIVSLHHMHFKKKHPEARWDKNLVETVEEDESEWNTSRAPLEVITTQKNRKQIKGNARSAKSRAALKDKVTLKCNFCSYSNSNHRSNMKTHIVKHHPGVVYNPKTCFTAVQNDDAGSDKENEEEEV